MMRLVLLVFLSGFILLDVGLTGWTWSTGFVGMRVSVIVADLGVWSLTWPQDCGIRN